MDKQNQLLFQKGEPLFNPLYPYFFERLKVHCRPALPAPTDKPCTCKSGYYTNTLGPAVVNCVKCGGRQKVNRFGEGEKK